MIDMRKLKELIRLMTANELLELDLRDKDEQVTIRRPNIHSAPQIMQAPVGLTQSVMQAAPIVQPVNPTAASKPTAPMNDTAGLIKIESPMVGTFYASASPDKPDFVSIGASVGSNSVVCLIEAMKIFNEINAGTTGTIEKILVKSGDAVEFGQAIFLVRPS
ncbi:MAG: acetyl-CoA carboxylase biotin carboxyl carrier protein [Phycisphaerales bacterium]|nr:acetyl-CoA carboxylase biotin carboxyl carrier protein [Phycisphaerales bacterium]